MEEQYIIIPTCEECETRVKDHHRFCPNCGAFLGAEAETIHIFNNSYLRSAFFFYLSYLAICLFVKYTNWFDNYDRLFWIEITLALLSVWFAWRNKESILPILKFNHFNWGILLGIITLSALCSWLVNISMTELNVSLFNTDISIYSGYKIYIAPIFVMLYSVALLPALFEELAFRGVLYHYLASILDERLVVMVSGFIFAAMHLNPIGLIWLIPFGIFLGFLRMKYNTIWYGVVFHFIFNCMACIMDLYRDGQLWWQ